MMKQTACAAVAHSSVYNTEALITFGRYTPAAGAFAQQGILSQTNSLDAQIKLADRANLNQQKRKVDSDSSIRRSAKQ